MTCDLFGENFSLYFLIVFSLHALSLVCSLLAVHRDLKICSIESLRAVDCNLNRKNLFMQMHATRHAVLYSLFISLPAEACLPKELECLKHLCLGKGKGQKLIRSDLAIYLISIDLSFCIRPLYNFNSNPIA